MIRVPQTRWTVFWRHITVVFPAFIGDAVLNSCWFNESCQKKHMIWHGFLTFCYWPYIRTPIRYAWLYAGRLFLVFTASVTLRHIDLMDWMKHTWTENGQIWTKSNISINFQKMKNPWTFFLYFSNNQGNFPYDPVLSEQRVFYPIFFRLHSKTTTTLSESFYSDRKFGIIFKWYNLNYLVFFDLMVWFYFLSPRIVGGCFR